MTKIIHSTRNNHTNGDYQLRMMDDKYIKTLTELQKANLVIWWATQMRIACNSEGKKKPDGIIKDINTQILSGSPAAVNYVSSFGVIKPPTSSIHARAERGSQIFDPFRDAIYKINPSGGSNNNNNNNNSNNNNNNNNRSNDNDNNSSNRSFPVMSQQEAISRLAACNQIDLEKTQQLKECQKEIKKLQTKLKNAQDHMVNQSIEVEEAQNKLNDTLKCIGHVFYRELNINQNWMIPVNLIRDSPELKDKYFNVISKWSNNKNRNHNISNDKQEADAGIIDEDEEAMDSGIVDNDKEQIDVGIVENDKEEIDVGTDDDDENADDLFDGQIKVFHEGAIHLEGGDDAIKQEQNEGQMKDHDVQKQDKEINLVHEQEEKKMEVGDEGQSDQGAMSEDTNGGNDKIERNWSQDDGWIDDETLGNVQMDASGRFIW